MIMKISKTYILKSYFGIESITGCRIAMQRNQSRFYLQHIYLYLWVL